MPRRWLGGGVLAVLMSVALLTSLARAREASQSKDDPKPAAPGKVMVSDVILQGSQRMTTEQIKVRMRIQVGNEYNSSTADEDVRELYKTNQFRNIRTLVQEDGPGKVKIYFLFSDVPNTVQKITFQGANHIKDEELRKLTGLRPGMPLNPNLNKQGCQKILEKYEEMGRWFSYCKLVKGGEVGDTEVLYAITEGPKVTVHDIKFIGNTFVNSARLMKKMHSTSQGVACIGSRYNKQMADGDVNELIKFYRYYGYKDVRVSLETQPSADGCQVTLIFHIQEGLRYRNQELPQFIGAKSISAEQLAELLEMRSEQYLDQAQREIVEKRIKDYFGYNDQDVQVVPVSLARVGQIIVSGNKHISSESILAHVPLSPGQTFSYPDLRQAEKTLADLGLFVVDPAKGVHPTIAVVDSGSDSAYKDILITVREKKAKRP